MFVDVDHFKRFNDLFGHLAGDECLRRVAQAMRSVVMRPTDLVARHGGEEFVALLPGADREGASQIARRIRNEVAELRIRHPDNGANGFVTVSIGAATSLRPQPTAPPEALVEAADRLMYVAKARGRNRTVQGDLAAADDSDVGG